MSEPFQKVDQPDALKGSNTLYDHVTNLKISKLFGSQDTSVVLSNDYSFCIHTMW